MLRQFNRLFLNLGLIFLSLSAFGQAAGINTSKAEIDSLKQTISSQVDIKLNGVQARILQKLEDQQTIIDSLNNELNALEVHLHHLIGNNEKQRQKIENAELEISRLDDLIIQEHRKFIRILYVSGPSILFLILVTILLVFLILNRQQAETEKKINALKRYAHNEIQESRSDLLKKIKKRLKKIAGRVDK